MNLTRWAIEKNRITVAALVIIVLGGVQAYFTLPRAEDPGFIIRTAQVVTHFPGASPRRVELLVTDKLEEAIQEMPELDSVVSRSRAGISIIFVNILERYKDMRPIWDSLRRKVATAEEELPEGIIGPTVNDEFGDVFGTIIALTGDGFSYAELKEIADQVRDELLRIDQVAKVEIHGAQEERIFVEYSTAKVSETQFSPLQLQSLLESENIILPGGTLEARLESILLEPSGNFVSLEDIRQNQNPKITT